MSNAISYYDLLGNSKKNLMEKGKKKLNAILDCHVAGPRALSHEVSDFIYILTSSRSTQYVKN